MKKVGLVTFYEANNYGTCLQAFALQKKIEKFGYECTIIQAPKQDKNINKSKVNKINILIKKFGIFGMINYLNSKKYLNKKSQDFSNFRKEFLSISPNYIELNKLANIYSTFVCGSDMMWSKEFFEELEYYALSFVPQKRKIAYAPSFGTPDIPDNMSTLYRKVIQDFKWLSCREKSGVELIKDLANKQAKHVVDPTLLFQSKDWLDLLKINLKEEDPYLLVYLFSQKNKKINDYINELSNKLNLKIKYVPTEINDFKKSDSERYGPKEFVELYANASFVISDGFHGLLFSIIFNQPFLLLHRSKNEHWEQYEDRMSSTLEYLGLLNRYVYIGDSIDESLYTLDYTEINLKLREQRENSIEYLKNALEECTNNG